VIFLIILKRNFVTCQPDIVPHENNNVTW